MTPDCEAYIDSICKDKYNICQGYLITSKGISLRFRRSTNSKKDSYYITFKCNTEKRVVEIEQKIDKRDFYDIWPTCLNKVYKIRYKKDGCDIDFLKDHNEKTYFALAEIEMEEGRKEPESIPSFVKENLIFKVPLTDFRFSSKLLSDVRYATELYSSLKRKK